MYSNQLLSELSLVGQLPGLLSAVAGIVGLWKIFEKAGEDGWKALIPFYNLYILLKVCQYPSKAITWLMLFIFLSPIIIILGFGVSLYAATAAESYALGSIGAIWFLLFIAVLVGLIIVNIKIMIQLAKVFGQSGGFAVGLILLQSIFLLILGLGKYEYLPNGAEKPNNKPAEKAQPAIADKAPEHKIGDEWVKGQ